MNYEEWLDYCFDRPITEPAWYFSTEPELDWFLPEPAEITELITRLFHDAGKLPERYKLEQVNQGLYFVVSHGSEYFFTVRECENLDAQVECVLGLHTVYRELFAKVCSDHYGHLNAGPEAPTPLNAVCYMLWDLDCIEGAAMTPIEEHLVDPIFEVLEGALELRSVACRESALHGLGHLELDHEERVQRIIDEFLAAHPDLPSELRAYAEQARRGMIL